MATRLAVFAAALSVVVAAPLMPAPAHAQERAEVVVPRVENSKFQFAGVINANGVQVRSGPSDNYYATMRLDKGTSVTVVGIKFDWLKITPPADSYSLISKAFVQRQGESNAGTVIGTSVRVRAGSTMTPLKTAVQCSLKRGEPVTIVGEQDEYYKIQPPAEAFLYVHQKFVDPVKQLNETPLATASNTQSDSQSEQGTAPTTQPVAHATPRETPDEDTTIAAKFQAEQAKVAQESTKVETEFDRLEAVLRASLEQRLEEQPLAELIKGYEKILQSDYLSVPMRRISEIRLLGLRGKYQAQQELLATRKQQQEMTDRINAIRAEREALEQKMAGNVIMYTAVGKLQPSTLQVGTGTLYRMVDPNTSRTVCYVRSSDPKYLDFIDQFVGVRGELTNDAQVALKVVNSTEIETVDPAKVNKGITAQVAPTSFLSNAEEKTQTQEAPAKEEKSEK